MQLCKHHDPVIRSLAKKQVVAWRAVAKNEQANYFRQTLAMQILQQQELEELPIETEPQIVGKQTVKPTLSRMQVNAANPGVIAPIPAACPILFYELNTQHDPGCNTDTKVCD